MLKRFVSSPLRQVRFFANKVEIPSRKEFILKAKLPDDKIKELYPEWDVERAALVKKRRVLRRYMRLKRNNFVRTNAQLLTD